MSQPLLELLIPALECRTQKRIALLDAIEKQIDHYHLKGTVAPRCYLDNGQATLGAKRNSLLSAATARYVAFIDDDDCVTADYVVSLVEAIYAYKDVDVVTFRCKRTVDGDESTAETLIYDLAQKQVPAEPSNIHLLPPNHLCAWRTDIAQRMEFAEDLEYGSDQVWWKGLVLADAARTQRHIPRCLYHYKYQKKNDGVSHDGLAARESQRKMGLGWKRAVFRDIETGMLLARADGIQPDGSEYIGDVALT